MEMRNKTKHVLVEPPTAVQLTPKLRCILYSTISIISRCYIERGQPREPRGRARMSPEVNFKLTWATYQIKLQHLGGAFGRFWALFFSAKESGLGKLMAVLCFHYYSVYGRFFIVQMTSSLAFRICKTSQLGMFSYVICQEPHIAYQACQKHENIHILQWQTAISIYLCRKSS